MSARHSRKNRAAWRPLAAAVAGGAVLVATGFGVWATLNATASNTTPQTINSGTLSLTLSAESPSAGFTSNITNMAPGDVVNRYVDLTNGGTLDAQSLTLAIAATGSDVLIHDGTSPATKALTVTVNGCSVGWTQTTGVCSGTTTHPLTATTLGTLSSAASLISGAIAASAVQHFQVAVTLPDQTETTVNGVAPATTIQGATASLTYTFTEAQRTATTTNS